MPNEKLKVLISYVISTIILSIYGGQVCPFLEYTVIGDAVNTTSRLETLSKSVSSRVVISKDVFERISPEMQSKVSSLGEYELKENLTR